MTTAKLTIAFDRIGRTHDVAPLVVELAEPFDADEVAFAVHGYARPHLRSSGVDVVVDIDEDTLDGTGSIFCGFHSGGHLTITGTRQETPDV